MTVEAGNSVAAVLGKVGLPEPVSALAARAWDVVVVGGGHNGLTCAAYLARAGSRVLVLEARERLGGAATLDQPFDDPGYVISPCAYVVGLLDDDVIRDLELRRRGLQVYVADPQLWVPFDDGTGFSQWMDEERTVAGLREELKLPDAEIEGYLAYEKFFDDMRLRLRKGARDTWVGDSPSRAELEELLGDRMMIDALFTASICDVLDEFVSDQRLKDALFGQGVIGTFAGPRDPGTASVKLMHFQGDLEGEGPVWGYVKGGMGMISFAIADAARDAGAVLAAGVPVAEILPGEGVRLDDGTFIAAPVVVSNADPKRMLGMVTADAVPDAYRKRLQEWDIRSPVVKFNARPRPAADLDGGTRPGLLGARHRRRHRGPGRRAASLRGVRGGGTRCRVRRDLRADRARPDARACGEAPDERLRSVRARTTSTAAGTPAASRWPASSST